MVSENYPPGTTTRDLKRAGIIDDREKCSECGELIHSEEDHADDCRASHMNKNDIIESEKARHAEDRLEERRLEEAMEEE
jgi:hypothetical protein